MQNQKEQHTVHYMEVTERLYALWYTQSDFCSLFAPKLGESWGVANNIT